MIMNTKATTRKQALCLPDKSLAEDLVDIRAKIFSVRKLPIMLAPDLAELYQVSTSAFNQAVKRNLVRFPEDFRFQLTRQELEEVITKCDNPNRLRFAPSLPYAFTEQGVAMLSGVLKSNVAVAVSIRIMKAFVAMRRTLASMAPLLSRVENIERSQAADRARQIAEQTKNEERFSEIFNAMASGTFPSQKVFFDGEVFDAEVLATKFIAGATRSILLIDNWVDINTLEILAKKQPGVMVEIVTSSRGNKIGSIDLSTFNAQYGGLTIKVSQLFHDRFLIIDERNLFLFGASLKDLGKKCFAFTRLDDREIPNLMHRLSSSRPGGP